MASPKTRARLEALTWVLIYGGLFLVVFGLVISRADDEGHWDWALAVPGVVLATAGAVLIYVRSRLSDS